MTHGHTNIELSVVRIKKKNRCVRRLIVGVYMAYLTTLLVAQITQCQKVVRPVNNELKGKWKEAAAG